VDKREEVLNVDVCRSATGKGYTIMKVVVQNSKTRDFLDENSRWTPNVSDAIDFQSSSEAASFCTDLRLADSQVALKLDGGMDVFLPIGHSCKQPA